MFDEDNQVQKGRQKCLVHRHKKADGTDNSTTPALVPSRKKNLLRKSDTAPLDKDAEELDRMEKLFKKHEMGEIPRVDWLDQIVFRSFEKRGLQAARSSMKMLQRQRSVNGAQDDDADAELESGADGRAGKSTFLLNIELPRFDFPVVFADHEYDPPPISALQSLSSSQAALAQKQPQVQFGPGINSVII
jgi:phosphatidylinositol 3-kinase